MELGEVYFWTSTIVMWKHLLKQDKYKTIIIESLKELTNRKLIAVYGFVIMPNHVHIIWEMLEKNKKEMPDSSFTKFTAHCFKKDLAQYHPQVLSVFKSEKYDRQYQFWQRDALAVKIISKQMLLQKLEYIHLNPLSERWNLAKSPEEYTWSSAKYY
ncbi:MAG: transposase [Bacteroidetes bacterium]|nr:MAG: transposase [Bacteroidota bacterium]